MKCQPIKVQPYSQKHFLVFMDLRLLLGEPGVIEVRSGPGEQTKGDRDQSISGDSDDSRFTITYDDQEDRVEEVGHQITKSGRAVVPPDRFIPDTTAKKSRLSPRERKRRQSIRKKEKKTRE